MLTFFHREALSPLALAVSRFTFATGEHHVGTQLGTETDERLLHALQRAEKNYRALFRNNPLPMWIYDTQTLAFLAANDAAGKHYGYSEEEFLDMTIKDIRPPEDVPRLLASLSRFGKGVYLSGLWRHKKKDGTIIQVEVTSHELEFEGHEARLVQATDVTERMRAQEALRDSEQRFRAIFYHAGIGIAMGTLEGRCVHANQAACDFIGVSKQEVVGLRIEDIVYSEDLHLTVGLFPRLISGEIPSYTVERRYQRKDGGLKWGRATVSLVRDAAGRPEYLIGVMEDITERKQMEESLRESEGRFRTLFEGAGDGIFIADSSGHYIDINTRGIELVGYSRAELWQRSVAEIFAPHERHRVAMELERVRSGRPSVSEWQFRRKDGSEFPGELSGQLLPDGRVIGILRDITERKQAQELLQSQAKHLEKLVQERTARLQEAVAEMESFSYSIAHDLRAPLRAMQGYAELVLEDLLPAATRSEARDYLQQIVTAASRMDELILDALNYTKLTRSEMRLQTLDSGALLREIVQSYPNMQPHRDEIQLQDPFPPVWANKAALTQCFSNLLGNAIKFVPQDRKPRIRVWAEKREERVRFWFEDNGIGIPKGWEQKIFQMFKQIDTTHGGTGIGLAIVRKAAERMGAEVGVESEPGQGSRFWLELTASSSTAP